MSWVGRLVEKWACAHKWGVLYSERIHAIDDKNKGQPMKRVIFYSCNKCGKVKKLTVK